MMRCSRLPGVLGDALLWHQGEAIELLDLMEEELLVMLGDLRDFRVHMRWIERNRDKVDRAG